MAARGGARHGRPVKSLRRAAVLVYVGGAVFDYDLAPDTGNHADGPPQILQVSMSLQIRA